jgi:hypothetical protein
MIQPTLSHRQKNYYKQFIVYFILLILLIIFMLTIGIKLLINLSLFIANRNTDSTPTTQESNTYLAPPTINDLPDATNSAMIKFSGSATSGNILTLYVNKAKVKEVSISDNTFHADATLDKGTNEIYLTLEDKKAKQKKDSSIYTITYIADKPKLDITSPHDGDKTNKNEIVVTGETGKDIDITVNGSPTVVNADGKFSYSLRLSQGDNKITIKARDAASNEETKELTVNYSNDN